MHLTEVHLKMKKLSRLLLVLLILAAGSRAWAGEAAAVHGDGWLEYVDGVRIVHLSGTPYEMGFQHGKLLENEIKVLLNYFFVIKGKVFGRTPEEVARGAGIMKGHIPDRYMEEMKGIADGAGVDFKKVVYTNVFLDVVSAAWVNALPQCSNFAMFPEITKDSNVIHGRNLDWSKDENLSKANTVFIYTPKDGVPHISMSWPSMAGTLTGMNSEQITMGEMTSVSSEATLDAMPIMIQLRMLLEKSKNLDDAFNILADNPRTTGYNVLVTDGKAGSGFIAEMTADNIMRIDPVDGFLVHTNHFVLPKMIEGQKKYIYLYMKGKKDDSFYRYERLTQLIQGHAGEVTAQDAIEFLGDKMDPVVGEVTGDMSNTVCRENTLQSTVMLPQSGEMYISMSGPPAPDGTYAKIKLIPGEKPD